MAYGIPKLWLDGYIKGLEAYAWWKDGVQYVGSGVFTLARAIECARQGDVLLELRKPDDTIHDNDNLGDGVGVVELKAELELLEQMCQDLTGENYMRQQGTYETEMSKLRADLKDVHDTYKQIVDERCASDEKHCTCVPALKQEIKKLREQLADSISRESVIATEQERDEAREAARWLLHNLKYECDRLQAMKRWPFLEKDVKEQEYHPRFELGRIVGTPGALQLLDQMGMDPADVLDRHVSGDWGDVDPDDARSNEEALNNGTRLLSSYQLTDMARVWVITEADRSSTTILLPEEY